MASYYETIKRALDNISATIAANPKSDGLEAMLSVQSEIKNLLVEYYLSSNRRDYPGLVCEILCGPKGRGFTEQDLALGLERVLQLQESGETFDTAKPKLAGDIAKSLKGWY